MKHMFFVVLFFSLLITGGTIAQDTKVKKEKAKKTVVAEKKTKEVKKQIISNKKCPVMGEDVDPSVQDR